MSEAQLHLVSSPCDAALDYVYGELSGEALTRFETHLATCASCQATVGGFRQVRAAVKEALPATELSDTRAQAMHAQLMLAAAQAQTARKATAWERARRLSRQPLVLAAMTILVVGGAVAVNWSRGTMQMPAASQATPAVAPAAPPPPVEVATPPAAAPGTPLVAEPELDKSAPFSKTQQRAITGSLSKEYSKAKAGVLKLKGGESLDGLSAFDSDTRGSGAVGGGVNVAPRKQLAPDAANAYGGLRAAPPAAPKVTSSVQSDRLENSRNKKAVTRDGEFAGDDLVQKNDLDRRAAPGTTLGRVDKAEAGPQQTEEKPAAAPPQPQEKTFAKDLKLADEGAAAKKPAAHHAAQAQTAAPVQAPSETQAAPATPAKEPLAQNAPAPVAAAAPAGQFSTGGKAAHSYAQNGSSNTLTASLDRADALADAGRCSESQKLFAQANADGSSRGRLAQARCLRRVGRLREAQRSLDQINVAAQPAVASKVAAEQRSIDQASQANQPSKASKKAAPADSATSY